MSFRFSDLAPRNLRRTWREGGPVMTAAIVALCMLVWLVEILASWLFPRFAAVFLLNGSFRPALFRALPWTALTSVFFHALDPLHIISNMLCLVLVGPLLERVYGHLTYLWIYLLSGLGGSLGLCVYSAIAVHFDPETALGISAFGASGAIFGLFGALLVVYRVSRVDRAQMTSLIILLALNLALPFFDHSIAWQAHVGGLIIGVLYCLALSGSVRHMSARLSFAAKSSIWAAIFLVLIVAGMVVLTAPAVL